MLGRLDELRDYPYYFQFTLTSYGSDVERNLPSKGESIVPVFQKLASAIGKERVVWRYDPILISERYSIPYHIKYFRMLCRRLENCTEKCTISFIDLYSKIQRRITPLGIRALTLAEMEDIAGHFSKIAGEHGICVDTCAESIDLSHLGIGHASCIDGNRLERIGGFKLKTEKDKNMRSACGCAASIDIGAYNTCRNACVYCYANYSDTCVAQCVEAHDPHSPLLYGSVKEGDIVKERAVRSLRENQLSLLI